jgi:hypothetical protein
MTAASYTTRPFAPLARPSIRWTRFLALLGVCLPVPICAVSGLSLPLPATVERIAASLVPWADGVTMSANEALHTGAGGSIVADTSERSGDAGVRLAGVVTTLGTSTKDGGRFVIPHPGVEAVVPNPGVTTGPGSPAPAAPDAGTGRVQPADGGTADGGTTPSAPSTPSESPTPAPGTAPTTPTEPAPPPVESDPDPVAAVKPVVDEALASVAPIVEETINTVEEIVAPVVPVLPGLGK